MPNDLLSNSGSFVPTTNVWEYGQIEQIDVNSDDFKQLLVRLYQNVNNIALALNIKDIGYYLNQEFNDGQQWFTSSNNANDLRPNFRTVVNFGALPNAGAKVAPHGITVDANLKWTKIYGAATDPAALQGIPLTDGSITSILVDATNVTITTSANLTSFTVCTVILEYCKT